ncbi:uncharacterized protein CHSO_4163 [Chryseobacterium sp. StRB126]|uniref:DUF1801 domain-containing protein n=1 Tax=Chryseobacterium sp. StRB126 TaxID=878220 RepID=UPI0004E98DDE|nr:DUF1801 domain-containing protein [Chryseobacterium sp. StRB126]BAP33200.1 uncharacterized protein CHSO_4163 [Chryseobacterium sp. StRB126]
MQIISNSLDDYLSKIQPERKEPFKKLFDVINENLPKGFEEISNYGMLGWVVPLKTYPAGYHCTPGTPLPFINLASQKNFIALYHMGLYSRPELLDWFVGEYPKHSKKKLDMGKSCVRFKNPEDIPFELIAELSQKMTVEDWISIYESQYKK